MTTKTFVKEPTDVGGKVQQARITAYIPHDVKERLEKVAESEDRTLSNLVAIILKRYVEDSETK